MRSAAALQATALLLCAQLRGTKGAEASCNIGTLYSRLSELQGDTACRTGCRGGSGDCGEGWLPSAADLCPPECGRVFEPLWDECGDLLVGTGMDIAGMDVFYDHCVATLYPPGSCGTFCNDHTFQCYEEEVLESCCDEGGNNCAAGSGVPSSCPVGCALVFPTFMATCRDHIGTIADIDMADYENFEEQCLSQDGPDLVAFAQSLIDQGCTLGNLAGHRRTQQQQQSLSGLLGDNAGCEWDSIDDRAAGIDAVCEGGVYASTCSPTCALAMYSFTTACNPTLDALMADTPLRAQISAFEQTCYDTTPPEVWLQSIDEASCPTGVLPGAAPAPAPPAGGAEIRVPRCDPSGGALHMASLPAFVTDDGSGTAAEDTTMQLCWTEESLSVSVVATDSYVTSDQSSCGDSTWNGDSFEIFLSPTRPGIQGSPPEYVQSTTPCTAHQLIANADECIGAAAALELPYMSLAGSEWASGCLFHGGAVYFSPAQDGSTENPTDGYICIVPGGSSSYYSPTAWMEVDISSAGGMYSAAITGSGNDYGSAQELSQPGSGSDGSCGIADLEFSAYTLPNLPGWGATVAIPWARFAELPQVRAPSLSTCLRTAATFSVPSTIVLRLRCDV